MDIESLTPQELAKYPILRPPSGLLPNFGNAPDRNASVTVLGSVLFTTMAIFFINRLYTKHFLIKRYSWDDCKLHLPNL